jgi:hypothetical protein
MIFLPGCLSDIRNRGATFRTPVVFFCGYLIFFNSMMKCSFAFGGMAGSLPWGP